MLKSPGFTATVLLTLLLTVGVNTALFSVIRAVLLRPLPFPEPERLVWITEEYKALGLDAALGSDFLAWKSDNQVFQELAAFTPTEVNLRGHGYPQRVPGMRVSQEFFAVLGIQPAIGRVFNTREDSPGGPATVILSQDLWRADFAASADILGSAILVDGEPASVIGVMPAGFDFPRGTRIWRPLALDAARETLRDRVSLLRVIGRLRPGVGLDRARGDLGIIQERIRAQFPEMYAQIQIRLTPLSSQLVSEARFPLFFLFGAVIFLLLIACANLTSLLLTRGALRRPEMGLRAVLGASRGRLVRQSFLGSLLLCLLGGMAGLLASPWILHALMSRTPVDFPGIAETRVDGSVLAFTLVICLLVALLCGIGPALAAGAGNPVDSLRGVSRRGRRPLWLRGGVVVAELALTVVLLIGAGLMVHSLWRLTQVDAGFDPEDVLTLSFKLAPSDYPEFSQKQQFLARLLERIGSLPGVQSVGASNAPPLRGSPLRGPVAVEGQPAPGDNEPQLVDWFGITPGYLETMGIELVAGREFSAQDDPETPVALVNQRFAGTFWGEEDPLGRRLKPRDSDSWITVVGVLQDNLNGGLDKEVGPEVYRPLTQLTHFDSISLVLRTPLDTSNLARSLRDAVFEINPNQPVYDLRMMNQILAEQGSSRRFSTLLLGSFALMALSLAALGLFGLMRYSISLQTREIGIHLCLGARRGDLVGRFVRWGLCLVLAGMGMGVAAALALSRFISGFLYGVSGTDPTTLFGVAFVFLVVGGLTSYLAARRILKVGPWALLRYQ